MNLYVVKNDLDCVNYVLATNIKEAIIKYENEFEAEIKEIKLVSKNII